MESDRIVFVKRAIEKTHTVHFIQRYACFALVWFVSRFLFSLKQRTPGSASWQRAFGFVFYLYSILLYQYSADFNGLLKNIIHQVVHCNGHMGKVPYQNRPQNNATRFGKMKSKTKQNKRNGTDKSYCSTVPKSVTRCCLSKDRLNQQQYGSDSKIIHWRHT